MRKLDYPMLRATYQTDGHMARDLFRQCAGLQRELKLADELNVKLMAELGALRSEAETRSPPLPLHEIA